MYVRERINAISCTKLIKFKSVPQLTYFFSAIYRDDYLLSKRRFFLLQIYRQSLFIFTAEGSYYRFSPLLNSLYLVRDLFGTRLQNAEEDTNKVIPIAAATDKDPKRR